jgi:hypothetical protein
MQPGTWFTPRRVSRIGELLDVLPSRHEPLPLDVAARIVWNHIGGPVDEVNLLLGEATAIGLLESVAEGIGRTPLGTRTRNSLRAGDGYAVGQLVLRSGYLADQARRLVESAVFDPVADCFRCHSELRREAPQLLAILGLRERVIVGGEIRLSRQLYEQVGTVWAFMEQSEQLPPWLKERQLVGHLAELFSWNFERIRADDPSRVGWVSQDDDSLGYDIEDHNASPSRCIEVKGSRGPSVQFIMSPNEMRKARILGSRYEIHFWGQLDLSQNPETHYDALVGAGYPITIRDPVVEFDLAGWQLEPESWRITQL